MTNEERCRLYLITPASFDPAAFLPVFEQAMDAGDVACVQLRLKDVDDDAIRAATAALKPIAEAHDAAFLMNDRPDLARELDCDGVHIGQDDTPYDVARKIVGSGRIVGVTCHNSRHLAMQAAEAGADYVAFGAFFPTATKKPKAKADLETLRAWSMMTTVPSVAIGGITPENCAPLVEAGADFLAVSSGVWNHADGPADAVKAFNAIFDEKAS